MRLVIYKSKRNDWGLAIVDADLQTAVITYQGTLHAAKIVASKLFNQELVWHDKSGQTMIETDHAGVFYPEQRNWIETTITIPS